MADFARSVAASGLSHTDGVWPDAPLDEGRWGELLDVVREQRLAGLLVHAISNRSLPAMPYQLAQARTEHFIATARVVSIETSMLQVVGQLREAGVDVRVLKGSAVANLDYPDPALRHFIDIDLLVRSSQFDRAVAALTAAGHVRRHPQPRAGFDRRFSKGTSFILAGRLGIDLHRTFVMGPFGLRVRLEDLWGQGDSFSVGGIELLALAPELRFLHACFHAALGDAVPRLVPQRDVAQMLQNNGLDLRRVEELMHDWRAEAVVARAVSHAWHTLRIRDSSKFVESALGYRPSSRAARELALYSHHEGSYARKSLGALLAVPGLRSKAAFARALAFPDRSYVAGRYSSAWGRWWNALRSAAGRRAPVRGPFAGGNDRR